MTKARRSCRQAVLDFGHAATVQALERFAGRSPNLTALGFESRIDYGVLRVFVRPDSSAIEAAHGTRKLEKQQLK